MGISDIAFVISTGIVSDTMSLAFSFLPTVVLFTKITPHKVEATVFACLTGAFNFSNGVGGPLLGSIVCKAFGVDSQHLDRYYELILVQIFAVALTFFYIKLVPKNEDIEILQKKLREERKKEVDGKSAEKTRESPTLDKEGNERMEKGDKEKVV